MLHIVLKKLKLEVVFLALGSGLLLARHTHVLNTFLYYSEIVDVLPLVECGNLYFLYLALLSIATTGWATSSLTTATSHNM